MSLAGELHREALRLKRLGTALRWVTLLLLVKVLVSIVAEYRYYFPADFHAAFLIGRESTFVGIYRTAFYTHIILSPLTLLLAAWLWFSGSRGRFRSAHRWLGRFQLALITVSVFASGAVMAWWTHAGTVAAVGFTVQAILTLGTALMAAYQARRGAVGRHRIWATRCLLLLVSPLVFRLLIGAAMVLEVESTEFYQATAWLSWLLPCLVYDTVRWFARRNQRTSSYHQLRPL